MLERFSLSPFCWYGTIRHISICLHRLLDCYPKVVLQRKAVQRLVRGSKINDLAENSRQLDLITNLY